MSAFPIDKFKSSKISTYINEAGYNIKKIKTGKDLIKSFIEKAPKKLMWNKSKENSHIHNLKTKVISKIMNKKTGRIGILCAIFVPSVVSTILTGKNIGKTIDTIINKFSIKKADKT